MRRRSIRVAVLLSAVAVVAFAAPSIASADDIPSHCRKHPITGELQCDYPKP